MKKILILVLMLTSIASFAQPQFGGQVGGLNNAGGKEFVKMRDNNFKVWDSTAAVYLLESKLKLDTLFKKTDSLLTYLRTNPLPTNAAQETSGNLDAINGNTSELIFHTTSLSNIETKLDDLKGYTDQIETGVLGTNNALIDGTQRTLIEPKKASGNITTQNLVPLGNATANSAVELNVAGYSGAIVQITGTHTGALSLQYTVDTTTWVTGLSCFYSIAATTSPITNIASGVNGIFKIPTFNATKIRITGLAAMTGTTVVTITAGVASGLFIDAGNLTGITNPITISSTGGSAYLVKGEDNNALNGDAGIPTWGVRRDAPTISAASTAKYNEYALNKFGSQYAKQEERYQPTYVSSFIISSVAASATDIFEMKGSATKTIYIEKIIIKPLQTTPGSIDFYLIKRSAANTGGTSTTATILPLDATDAAATAVINSYTANPTITGTIGNIQVVNMWADAATNATQKEYTIDFGERGKPITLNSASQTIAGNLNATTVTGGKFYVTIQWREQAP